MTPPLKTEGVPGRCRARYSMTEPYWMRAAIDGTNAFQLLLAAATSIPPAFHPPPNVFGRCVDDSCHAAGLGLALGLRVRGVALRRHRSAAPRRAAVSLKGLARLRRVMPEGSIPTDSLRLVSFVLRVSLPIP